MAEASASPSGAGVVISAQVPNAPHHGSIQQLRNYLALLLNLRKQQDLRSIQSPQAG